MKNKLIDSGIQQLNTGIEGEVPHNLAYRILVSDVVKINNTWQSIKIAKTLTSPTFKPLMRQRKAKNIISVGEKTPTKMFYYPILSVIEANGNSANIKTVYKEIENSLVFTTQDITLAGGGSKQEPLWRITVRWAKEELIQKGIIKRNSPKGIWEMTPAGKKWFGKQKGLNS